MKSRSPGALERAAHALVSPRACRYGALVFFMLLLVIGAIPGKAEALSAVVYDKLLHLIAYAVLTALVYGALPGGTAARAVRTLLIIAILGGIDEGIQSLFSYRNASWIDWSIDMLAGFVAVGLLVGLDLRRRRKSQMAVHRESTTRNAEAAGNR
jgi:VanZ family protein